MIGENGVLTAADIAEYQRLATIGDVRWVVHPDFPECVLLDYTSIVQRAHRWSEYTSAARGLIIDRVSGKILARPFSKFFNVGEYTGPIPGGPVEVTDKMDGSLGIFYLAANGDPTVSTRGAFTSPQAIKATEVFRSRYWNPLPESTRRQFLDGGSLAHLTLLFEIIYPGNRIVLDYGQTDDLFLIGVIDKRNGRDVSAATFGEVRGLFGFNAAERFPVPSFEALLATPPRCRAEGYVIRFVETDLRLKLKFEEYLRVHKLLSMLTPKNVLEHLREGDFEQWIDGIPDEYNAWTMEWAQRFQAEAVALNAAVEQTLATIQNLGLTERKDQAIWVTQNIQSPALKGLTFRRLPDARGPRPPLTLPELLKFIEAPAETPALPGLWGES